MSNNRLEKISLLPLRALAQWVHSLNVSAFDTKPAGNVAAGEVFFFGNGGCAGCHMVQGRGKANGPDLSSTGRRSIVRVRVRLGAGDAALEVADLMRHFIADYDAVVASRKRALPYMLDAHRQMWQPDIGMNRFIGRTGHC